MGNCCSLPWGSGQKSDPSVTHAQNSRGTGKILSPDVELTGLPNNGDIKSGKSIYTSDSKAVKVQSKRVISDAVKMSDIVISAKSGGVGDTAMSIAQQKGVQSLTEGGADPGATVDLGHSPTKKPAKYTAKFDQRVTAKYDIKVWVLF